MMGSFYFSLGVYNVHHHTVKVVYILIGTTFPADQVIAKNWSSYIEILLVLYLR